VNLGQPQYFIAAIGVVATFAMFFAFTESYAENVIPDQPEKKKLYEAHQKLTNTMLSQQQNQFSTTLDTVTPQSLSPQTESAYFDVPLFLSYVDSSSNKLVVGIDYRSPLSIEESRTQLESFIGQDIPMEIGFGFFTRDSCNLQTAECDPLIGGISVSSDFDLQAGTLGIPVSTGNSFGIQLTWEADSTDSSQLEVKWGKYGASGKRTLINVSESQ